jgi:hypothetical protein
MYILSDRHCLISVREVIKKSYSYPLQVKYFHQNVKVGFEVLFSQDQTAYLDVWIVKGTECLSARTEL